MPAHFYPPAPEELARLSEVEKYFEVTFMGRVWALRTFRLASDPPSITGIECVATVEKRASVDEEHDNAAENLDPPLQRSEREFRPRDKQRGSTRAVCV